MDYKAIIFDLDNTLGNRTGSAYYTYRDMLLEHTSIEDEILLEAIIQDCLVLDQFGTYNKNFVIENINRKYALNLKFDDFNQYWRDNSHKKYFAFNETIDTLKKLKEKYRLAIISNGDYDCQMKKLEKINVLDYVEEVIISSKCGIEKPNVGIFNLMLDKLNIKANEAVYVGDMFSKDILGAYNAGLKPIIICSDINRIITDKVTRIERISDLCNIL